MTKKINELIRKINWTRIGIAIIGVLVAAGLSYIYTEEIYYEISSDIEWPVLLVMSLIGEWVTLIV